VVPEQPDIPPETNAERLATFMVQIAPRWRSAEFFDRLENFGIPRRQRFDKLSKGQQRQMALALALAASPQLLVLDDPTLGLDAVARRELFEELIGDLADHGTTVFLTTHDLSGVEGIADRVGILKNGNLLVDESLEALKSRFCRLTLAADGNVAPQTIENGLRHLGAISSRRVAGVSDVVVGNFSEVGFGRLRDEVPVEVERVDSLPLEEIFIALCGEDGGHR
jgi:ABC-2 type transport system ATP-binding protein